ncbi:MAG: hypothetical protein Q9220_001859 [cf. Caloplaca sp. 1 TL-2023]
MSSNDSPSEELSDHYSNENLSRKRQRLSTDVEDSPSNTIPAGVSTISRIKPRTAATAEPHPGELKLPAISNGKAVDASLDFASLGTAPWLIATLNQLAIKRPTGIQKGCIPKILEGRDVIGGSKTGSGKTMAFMVPIVQRLAKDSVGIFAVILTPTRRARIVVLDEADRLLAPGAGSMLPDVETCLSALPPSGERQTCLFTATVTPEVMALKNLPRPKDRPPIFVCEVGTSDIAVPSTLQQSYLQVPLTYREAYLHTLLLTHRNVAKKAVMVFCNRTATANLLERLLRSLEHRVTSLHSLLPQSERISNLSRFRASAARILVATDVASRGLDITGVDLVINYDLPRNPDDYIHRVGRTARAGKKGDAITLVGQRDVQLFLAIESRVGIKMSAYEEEGVNIETRVIRDALKVVGVRKREAMLGIEEGRDVKGNRTRGKIRRLE